MIVAETLEQAEGAIDDMLVGNRFGAAGAEVLIEEFESGMTKIGAKGGYSNSDMTVVYFVVNRFQVVKMKDIVHEIDPLAYITISEVADVFIANQDKQK